MKSKRFLLCWALACCSLTMQAQFSGSGSGTAKDPYLVTTVDELFEVRSNPSSYYKLMNDIDLSAWLAEEFPTQGWLPIPSFTGTFDGNNHSISGLFINRPSTSDVGLFAQVTAATIANLTLISPNIVGSNSTGTLVGRGTMTLDNITVTDATIEGSSYTGGIVGNCESGATISTLSALKVFGANISGYDYVGGCVGYTDNSIDGCQEMNIVINGNSYLGGLAGRTRSATNNTVIGVTITGFDNFGGLVGHLYYGSITDCFVFNCNLSGNHCLGGIAGIINSPYSSTYNEIRRCYVAGNLFCSGTGMGSKMYAGGIAGYMTRNTSNKGALRIRDCRFDGHIRGNAEFAAGIVAQSSYTDSNSPYIGLCIVSGSIYGKSGVYGISPVVNNYTVCCADTVYSTNGTAFRAGTGSSYAYNGMVVYSNNKKVDVEDGGANGNGYSLRLLKKASSYIGQTFDFDNVWTIDEGNSFPYLIGQSSPPTITSCISGENVTIKGTAPEDGTVYVFVGNKLFEGSIVSGQWNIKLGELEEGAVVNTYVVAAGKKPSTQVSCIAESRGLYAELDETSNEMPEAATGVDVRVLRTIKAGEWSTICLPFAMTAEQVTEAFGSDVELGDFNGYDVADDGNTINVKFNAATAIKANHPYIIKVGTGVTEFTVDGVDIDPQEAEINLGTSRKPKAFVGNYVAGTAIGNGCLFLNNNKFWYSVGTTKIKAFRAYFDFNDLLPDFEDNYAEARVFIMFDDGETTGINEMRNEEGEMRNVYNLNGQRVSQPARGLYIVNGKKAVIK